MKKEVKFGKRGQITLFMLLGIIILASLGMFAYFKSAVKLQEKVITTEYAPVTKFVDSCITDIAKEGIRTLGLNGGYIYFPEIIERNPMSFLSTAPIKTLKNPYWWYEGITAVPSEDFIKNQIETYVETELETCLNNFEDIKDYEIRPVGDITAITVLATDDVIVKVNYPMLAKKDEQIIRIDEFMVNIPIRLKKTYELAKKIMEYENRDMFLEKKTIDLLALDPNIPVSDIKFTCEQQQWLLSDIKPRLQTLLRVNLPYVKVKGTDYDSGAYVPTPTGAATYNTSYYNYHYIWDVEESALTGMHVSLTYDEKWPLTLFARPSTNGVLKSNADKGQEMLSFFCMHIIHFTYDVIYPVMVSIADERTGEHERFLFRFPFKVSVNHNQPYRQSFGHTLLDGTEKIDSGEYCAETTNEITVYTIDKATQEAIDDVNLSVACGGFECELGTSEWFGFGAAAGLTKEMPYCVQAVLIGNKEGYDESKTFIQTDIDGKSYNLEMTPIKEFDDYFVVKHDQGFPLLEQVFDQEDKAVITLSIPEKNFETYGVYPAEQGVPIKLLAKEDNTYRISVYVTNGEDFVGGYVGSWTVTKEDIESADSLKFHTVSIDAESDEERYLFFSGLQSYSKEIPKPETR